MRNAIGFQQLQQTSGTTIGYAVRMNGQLEQSLQADQLMHIASAYKVIVAIAIAQAIAEAVCDWGDDHTIEADGRIPDSPFMDEIRDGMSVTIDRLMHAMIAVSDNTATAMLQNILGEARLMTIVNRLELSSIQIPYDLQEYHRLAQVNVEVTQPIAALANPNDLVACYDYLLRDSMLPPSIHEHLMTILQAEDKHQGKSWPDGITCYRKSGYLEIPPFYAMSMAGALVSAHHRITFAFVINLDQPDEAKANHTLRLFQQDLKTALNELSAALYLMEYQG